MNVNGLTGAGAKTLHISQKQTQNRGKANKSHFAARVSLSKAGKGTALQVLVEKSLSKILEMTKLSAEALGYDLSTLDASPEATSSRIANFAIGLFGLYKKQNPDFSEEEALDRYEKLIKNAVNTGYREAMSILSGLGVEDPDVVDTARLTINMTFEKLDDFFRSMREALTQKRAEEAESGGQLT